MKAILLRSACALLALAFAGRGEPSPADDEANPSARLIAKDLGDQDLKAAYLLAYRSQVDDRPLFVESVLVAIERRNGSWRLVHAYRHPKDERAAAKHWHLSVVFDARVEPSREFDHRPTKAEVEEFIADSWWKFAATNGFRLVRGQVFAETWQQALDYQPAHRFPAPDA